jgi:hypothetical protein
MRSGGNERAHESRGEHSLRMGRVTAVISKLGADDVQDGSVATEGVVRAMWYFVITCLTNSHPIGYKYKE